MVFDYSETAIEFATFLRECEPTVRRVFVLTGPHLDRKDVSSALGLADEMIPSITGLRIRAGACGHCLSCRDPLESGTDEPFCPDCSARPLRPLSGPPDFHTAD